MSIFHSMKNIYFLCFKKYTHIFTCIHINFGENQISLVEKNRENIFRDLIFLSIFLFKKKK